jgi:ATP-binding cassette subfamily F protein 3
VALSMFVLVPHNLLLLDEPSNHLDLAAMESLTQALVEYSGTVVIVTHNRQLCEQMGATHVAMVTGDGSVLVRDREVRDADWDEIARLEKAGVGAEVEKEGDSDGRVEQKQMKQLSYELQKKKGNGSPNPTHTHTHTHTFRLRLWG